MSCEFHVEGSERHPLARNEMETIASEYATIAGGQLYFHDRRKNAGLWIQPASQDPSTIARTLIEFMKTRSRLLNALSAESR